MKTHLTTDGWLTFWCPGCNEHHGVPADRWHWNGDREKPTLTPSVKITSGHYAAGWQPGSTCWCTYNAEHKDDPAPFKCAICHFHLINGELLFQGDCTHSFIGRKVDLEDLDEQLR
jgi:hypothetical protein